MRKLVITFLIVSLLVVLSGCKKTDDAPDTLAVQNEIEAITKRLEALQSEENGKTNAEVSGKSQQQSGSKNSTDARSKEIADLLKQLKVLQNKYASSTGSKTTNSKTSSGGKSSSSKTHLSGCNFAGESLAHGQQKNYYKEEIVAHGGNCESKERSCNDGVMQGNIDYKYRHCSVRPAPAAPGAPANCILDGTIVISGNSHTFYDSLDVPHGNACQSIERRCDDGALSGSGSYKYVSCSILPDSSSGSSGGLGVAPRGPALGNPFLSQNCTLDGTTIINNTSKTFYAKDTVDAGEICDDYKGERSCHDGELSGDEELRFASCTSPDDSSIIPNPSGFHLPSLDFDCTLDGVTVNNGDSYTFYSDKLVSSGNPCSDYSQSRTCNTGLLSGSNDYKYASCQETLLYQPTEDTFEQPYLTPEDVIVQPELDIPTIDEPIIPDAEVPVPQFN